MPLSDFFESCVAIVIKNEGGDKFTADVSDRGGATRFGISHRTLSFWRGFEVPVDDVKNLSRGEAEAIYKALYWQSNKLDQIKHPGIAFAMFDSGVLFGVGKSALNAQIAAQAAGCSTLKADGIIGPNTLAALNAVNAEVWLRAFQALFIVRINSIVDNDATQAKWKGGWLARIDRLKNLA